MKSKKVIMAKITEKEFSACYEQAKLVFDGNQSKEKSIESLVIHIKLVWRS